NVHLITLPQPGAPRDTLWRRFASVIGVEADSVEETVTLPNESLGLVEVETLRRVNMFAPRGVDKPLKQLMVRQVLGDGILAQRPHALKFGPPADEHPWVVSAGAHMVNELRALDFDLVGDLDELLPAAEPAGGPLPDDVDDTAVAAGAG